MALLIGLSNSEGRFRACHGEHAAQLDELSYAADVSDVDHWVQIDREIDEETMVQMGWQKVGRAWRCPACAQGQS